ncbi:Cys-Gly metallodipeptidase dug1 [Grifola frondosa]|uniref:Cys-Gly metallodipeptidase dug1 n=1 Tax=Grifola frondosa TaxID=5627 RepID=A0A1C7LQ60_GRIFR|nr:Cys-Gly metallodipeptidase dug1 [Grifola frondosa]
MSSPLEFLRFIDENADRFIQRLGQAVAIPSISGDGTHRQDVFKMGSWLEDQLKSLGVETKQVDLGKHTMDDQELPLPPAILGRIGHDPKKTTILVYGHYDVQPASKSDGWDTEPFELVVDSETGRLIGRGSTDDKGPIMGWLNVLEAHKALGLSLPVNMRFCFEGMEESGSEGLDDLITSEAAKGKKGWFDGVDCVCIVVNLSQSDNYWLNTRTPCLTYGLRGIKYFKVTVSGPARDLHSGAFGRMVHEPMTDLVLLMSKLVAPDGTILIPGVDDMVPGPSSEETAIYDALDYSVQDVVDAVGAPITLSEDKTTLIMGRMRFPSLSLHGIEGGVRETQHEEQARFGESARRKPWIADYKHWNYEAAKKATEAVYKKSPDLTREGGSIPVTLTFAESLGVNVLLLPMGRGDDGAHSTNEKLDRSNFIEGSKLLGTYLYAVAAATE